MKINKISHEEFVRFYLNLDKCISYLIFIFQKLQFSKQEGEAHLNFNI